jgi:S-adenosylmethionine/arginine decarboxylase-like enzyme
VNASHPLTVRAPTNEGAIIAAVERHTWTPTNECVIIAVVERHTWASTNERAKISVVDRHTWPPTSAVTIELWKDIRGHQPMNVS